MLAAAQLWAVVVSWGTPHEQYATLAADYLGQRRADDGLVAVPAFMARPVEVVLRAERQPAAINGVDVAATAAAFQGRPVRVWLVSGGVWIAEARADHAVSVPAPPGYRVAWQRFYPDATVGLTLYERVE